MTSKSGNGFLSTTTVNGLLVALRHGLEVHNSPVPDLESRFASLEKFPFANYKSSQYTVMGTDIAEQFLKAE